MNEFFFTELSAWLTQVGLDGTLEPEIVFGFCERCVAAGMPLARSLVAIDTLDPVHEGRVFRWGYNPGLAPMVEYGRTSQEGLAASVLTPRMLRPPNAGVTALSITCCKLALRCCDDD